MCNRIWRVTSQVANFFEGPEFDARPDYVDYFSGVDKFVSGSNSDRIPDKNQFQPSKHEARMVRRSLHRSKCGSINMDSTLLAARAMRRKRHD